MLRATFNIDSLAKSDNGKVLLQLLMNHPKTATFLKPLFATAGIEASRDIKTLMAFANGKPPKNLVLSLRGAFEPEALLDSVTQMTNGAAQKKSYAGTSVVSVPGQAWIAAKDGCFFASAPGTIQEILDGLEGGTTFSANDLGGVVAESAQPDTSHDFVLSWDDTQHDFEAFGANQRPPQADKILSIDGSLDVNPELLLVLRINFEDEASAQQGMGMTSAAVSAKQAPAPLAAMGIDKLGDFVKLTRSGTEVELRILLPAKVTLGIMGLLQGMAGRG